MFDDALDAVRTAHNRANDKGVAYCIVAAPSGSLLVVPEDQCRVEYLEKVNPVTKRYSKGF